MCVCRKVHVFKALLCGFLRLKAIHVHYQLVLDPLVEDFDATMKVGRNFLVSKTENEQKQLLTELLA